MVYELIRRTGMVLLLALIGVTGALAQDLLVTNAGESLTVYNLEVGPTAVFYQLSADANAEIKRIAKTDVLIIRKADGTKIDPNAAAAPTSEAKPIPAAKAASSRALHELPPHEVVTVEPSSAIETDKKGRRTFSATTPGGHMMNFQILSDEQHTLAVIGSDCNNMDAKYVIPDYVTLEGLQYAVTEIAEQAFQNRKLQYITFPSTLKRINELAFEYSNLKSIILPEGLEELGAKAFCNVRWLGGRKQRDKTVDEIYIPESVKTIGRSCFHSCGGTVSYRGYCQAYFSCMPLMITESNSKDFGIDEEAVETYKQALRDKR